MLIDRKALLGLIKKSAGVIRDTAANAADNPDRLSDFVWSARQARLAGVLDGLALAEQAVCSLGPADVERA